MNIHGSAPPRSGLFISFEGIDGSGKSLQARLLADWLKTQGHPVLLTREPGGSPGAEEIRDLVLRGDTDRWSAETELLLFTAARRDHVERIIMPALNDGKVVITDRFVDSTRIYQGETRGPLRKLVDDLHDLIIKIEPDLTFLIDLDPEIALSRARGRGDDEQRFESFGLDWQKTLRTRFLDLAKNAPERIKQIDGKQSIEEINADIRRIVDMRL